MGLLQKPPFPFQQTREPEGTPVPVFGGHGGTQPLQDVAFALWKHSWLQDRKDSVAFQKEGPNVAWVVSRREGTEVVKVMWNEPERSRNPRALIGSSIGENGK